MKVVVAVAVASALACPAFGQRETFAVNPETSVVKITLNTTHEVVNGTFHVQSGTIEFDRSVPKMAGSVVVLAGSGNTGNGARDRRMNKDILLVGQHATVTFEPKSYTGTIAAAGDSNLQVSGIFTLLGTPHAITVPMLVHRDGAGATAKAHFMVPYVEWGVKNPSFLIWKADSDVAIDLNLSGTVSR